MSIDTQRLHLQEKIRSHYNCYYSTPLKKLVQLSIPCKYLCNITWCGYIIYSTIPHQWVPRSFPVVYCYKFCYNKHPYIIMFLFQENQYFQNWEFLELQFCLEGPRKLRVSQYSEHEESQQSKREQIRYAGKSHPRLWTWPLQKRILAGKPPQSDGLRGI